jgi:hypothetical protein
MRSLLTIAALLFSAVAARADGIDNFTWSDPDGHAFSWAWAASGPASEFATFTDGFIYAAHLSVESYNSISFNCESENCVDPMTSYFENFASPFFTETNGVITFIPGTYVSPVGVTDIWGATMTVVDPPLATDESGTAVLEIFGLAGVGLLAMLLKTRRGGGEHGEDNPWR